jgi:hypothetical protein
MALKILTLKRIAMKDIGVFGVLIDTDGIPFALTLERPWLDNKPNESCIPRGTYTCVRVVSPKFGDTFKVSGVKGRTHILFHKGNIPSDSHGCILIGEQFEPIGGVQGIASSAKGFDEFMEKLAGEQMFIINIQERAE